MSVNCHYRPLGFVRFLPPGHWVNDVRCDDREWWGLYCYRHEQSFRRARFFAGVLVGLLAGWGLA